MLIGHILCDWRIFVILRSEKGIAAFDRVAAVILIWLVEFATLAR